MCGGGYGLVRRTPHFYYTFCPGGYQIPHTPLVGMISRGRWLLCSHRGAWDVLTPH